MIDIGKACEELSFFQVVSHGVPLNLVRDMETMNKEFFDQSTDEKRKVKKDDVIAMGYCEHTPNVRDWKEMLDIMVEDAIVISTSPDPQDQELTEYFITYPIHL